MSVAQYITLFPTKINFYLNKYINIYIIDHTAKMLFK